MREINQSINQRLFTFINPFDETIMHSFSISVKCHLNGIGSRDIIEINIEFMNKRLEAKEKSRDRLSCLIISKFYKIIVIKRV